jgi:hypothetical protein
MFEHLGYPIIGFVATYVVLEVAWRFTSCKISDKTIKPSMLKQVRMIVVPSSLGR